MNGAVNNCPKATKVDEFVQSHLLNAAVLMGITPSGDTRASIGTSDAVTGITPSSSICSEYDSATASAKPNCLILIHFLGLVQPRIYQLHKEELHTKQRLLPIPCFCKVLVIFQKGIIVAVEMSNISC